jgi:hypothetical protein
LRTARLFAVAASLLLVTSSLPAQISWGPALGVNMATLAGDDVTDAKMQIGLALGILLDKTTDGKPLFWRTGLLYSQQGAKEDDPGPPAGTFSTKLAYVNIPVLAGWRFTPTKPTGGYVLAGAQLGFKAGCKFEFESGGSSSDVECDDPSIGAEIKSTDIGAVIGGGFAMMAGANTIHIALTYNLGLTTIDGGDPAADVKNRVLAITASWMMARKKAP